MPGDRRRLLVNRAGLASLLESPKNVQRQALRKMAQIEAAPESVGYPLRGKLAGFRGVHSGRYRIIWRILTLEGGQDVAEVCYVGIRSEGDERDAYAEAEKLFGSLGWLLSRSGRSFLKAVSLSAMKCRDEVSSRRAWRPLR